MTRDKWIIAEKMETTHYFHDASPIHDMTVKLTKFGFTNLKYSGTTYLKGGGAYIFCERELNDRAQEFTKLILANPKILDKINKEVITYSKKLYKFGEKILKVDFSKISNAHLADYYEKFEDLHNNIHVRRTPMWVIESGGGAVFSGLILEQIKKAVPGKLLGMRPEGVFATLTKPIKKIQSTREEIDFLKLILRVKKSKTAKYREKQLVNHAKKYCWLPYGCSGPAWKPDYFQQALKNLLSLSEARIRDRLLKISSELKNLSGLQKRIKSEIKLNRKWLHLIDLIKDFVYVKGLSKEAMFFGFYASEALQKEMCKRLKIDLRLLRCILPWEVRSVLLGGGILIENLKARWNYSIHYVEDGKSTVYVGQTAEKMAQELGLGEKIVEIEAVRELKGNCAQLGKVSGVVKIINSPKEIEKMTQGDILVSRMTEPELLPALKKAAAIVTDMGGITCHAAIVSRELGIPCVIGTKIATQIFKDGDLIEVDANHSVVRIINSIR